MLTTSAGQGDGSPITFYERMGFERTGEVHSDEVHSEVVLRLNPIRKERSKTLP